MYLQRSVTASYGGHQAKGLNLSFWTRTELRVPHTIKYVCQTWLRKHWEWVPSINVKVSVKLDCASIESESHQSMWRWMGLPQLNTKEEEESNNNNKEEETQLWCCVCTVNMCLQSLVKDSCFVKYWNFSNKLSNNRMSNEYNVYNIFNNTIIFIFILINKYLKYGVYTTHIGGHSFYVYFVKNYTNMYHIKF